MKIERLDAAPAFKPITFNITIESENDLRRVVIDFPIRLVQLPVDDHRLVPLTLTRREHVDLYPVKRAIMLFRRYAKESHGITEGARDALDSLKERS